MDLDAFLAAAEDLLAVPSTAERPDELRRAVEYVVDFVGPGRGPGFTVERFESNGKPSALIYRATDNSTRPPFRVVLNGHLDVVPGAPEQFRPRRDGNLLRARGAQDMKLSALVQALVFRELAPALPYPLALQLVADEEVGGRDGTLHQIEQGVTGQFVVLGEHSRLDVVADSKGLLHATLEAGGRSAHGAYPWLGDNALLALVESVARLMARYPAPKEEVWRTTVNLARMETPNRAFNQVPDRARAWLDIRFPADDTDLDGRTVEEVSAYLGTFCAPGVTVAVDHLDPPHRADHDLPDMHALRAAAQAQGYPANFLYKHGSGDGGFYSARGMAAVSLGVGGDGQHGPEEYAEIDTILPYHRALTTFLQSISAL